MTQQDHYALMRRSRDLGGYYRTQLWAEKENIGGGLHVIQVADGSR